MTFASRRLRLVSIAALLAALLAWLNWLYDLSLRDASFFSGWLLFGGMVFLTLYNIRKKLPFLPLLSSSFWLQLHIYSGLLVLVAFLLHTAARPPQGLFETALWALFLTVALSGVAGLLLSRTLPNRIRERGQRVNFERIPRLRAELGREVEGLAMQLVTESGSSTIASYHAGRLQSYFQGPRNFVAHLRGKLDPFNKVRGEIESLRRYLNDQEREILDEIRTRVLLKNVLDRQFALQSVLKGWLFVHIALTYALLLVSLCHMILAYAFATGTI